MRTLYIVRGASGSGKSTIAKRLVDPLRHFEADMWMVDEFGCYRFDPSKLPYAHSCCLARTCAAMNDGSSCDVAVSNTFTRPWEYTEYIIKAQECDYDVCVMDCHGDIRWNNTHDCPDHVMKDMRRRFVPHGYTY